MAQEDPTTATIVFATSPPVSAMVFWGRKNLGKITGGKPLVVVRPRDSGPSKEAALEALADAGTPSPIAPPPFQMVPTPAPAGQSPLLTP
jgi:hypothetical protein